MGACFGLEVSWEYIFEGDDFFCERLHRKPGDVRSCDNLDLFKRELKTHPFKNYFNMYEFFSYPCQMPRS